jgi:hypothetical protein
MNKLLITLCASSLVFNSQAGLVESKPVQNQSPEELEKAVLASHTDSLFSDFDYKWHIQPRSA